MTQQTPQLNIGDKIGFVIQANGIDENDRILFFPVVEITTRDGERAYKYQFPDGEVSRSAIRQSDLAGHFLQIEPQVGQNMLCLSTRRDEFCDALARGKNSRLEVYADWEKDAFVVVNLDNKAEYHVQLENHRGQLYADCECPDFKFRRRICKHQAAVLTDVLFSTSLS